MLSLFRGSLQRSLYKNFVASGWGKEAARHMAIWSSAAIFGTIHIGSAPTANPVGALFFGAYMGYLYQPATDEFDMITAMAFHTWYNLLASTYFLQISGDKKISDNKPTLSIAFEF